MIKWLYQKIIHLCHKIGRFAKKCWVCLLMDTRLRTNRHMFLNLRKKHSPATKWWPPHEDNILLPCGHIFRCLNWVRKPASQAWAEIHRNFVHSGTRTHADHQPVDPPLGAPETELFMFKGDDRFEGLEAGAGYKGACFWSSYASVLPGKPKLIAVLKDYLILKPPPSSPLLSRHGFHHGKGMRHVKKK